MPTNPKQLVSDAKARMRHSVDAVLRAVLGGAEVEAMLANGHYRRDVY